MLTYDKCLATHHIEAVQGLVTGTLDRTARDANDNTEKIRTTRTYSLVARVVVRLPEEQAGREESTSWKPWDAVALDAFVQVVGLPM